MRRLTALSIVASTALLSCGEPTGPTPSVGSPDVRSEIRDGRNGGATNFYFLPPLTSAVLFPGVFDGGRSPVVEVCSLNGSGDCDSIVARFTTTSGSGSERIRIDTAGQSYGVPWHTNKLDASLGSAFRITVLDGSSELGHADVRLINSGKEAKALPSDVIGRQRGSTIPILFRIEGLSGGTATRLEIEPGSFLLPAVGSTLPLVAKAYDAAGQQVDPGPISWSTSKPSVIAVSSSGNATAVAAAGSAKITAQAGGLVSAPALGLVAQVPAGALLVTDENILPVPAALSSSLSQQAVMLNVTPATSVMIAVDPAAPYQPGWRYKVWLTGVTPTVGQVIVSQGEAAIGGRVISVSPSNGNVEVILELMPLRDLLPGLSIDETFALEVNDFDAPQSIRAGFDVSKDLDGRITFKPKRNFSFASGLGAPIGTSNILDTEVEFEVGPFKCKVIASGAPVRPVVSNYTYDVDPSITFDLSYTPSGGLQKLVVRGGIDARVAVTQRYPVQVEEKLECEIELGSLPLPVAGPLGLFIGGSVGIGVGFELGGKLAFGDIGVEASVSAGASLTMGLDYATGTGPFAAIDGSSPQTRFTLLYPETVDDLRSEFSAGAFVAAKLEIGSLYFDALQFELYGVKAGPKQAFQLATPKAQAGDPAYASSVKTSFDVEAATGSKLTELGNLLGLNMAAVKFENSVPLAQTPRIQSFVISPEFVGATTSSDPGEEANFILTLDPVTYMGAYAVDSIELFRRKSNGAGNFTLEKVPGNCGQFAALPGQSAFTCATVLPSSWVGEQTVHAFVKARAFGASIPLLLELGEDAKATFTVDTVSIVVTPSDTTIGIGATNQFTAIVTGLVVEDVTWTATGGSISSTGLYTADSVPGTYEVVATSVDDPTRKGTARIIVEGEFAVRVTPRDVIVSPRGTTQFSAEINGLPSTLVSWRTTDPGGTVTAAGLYTAGATPGIFAVVAASLIDSTARDSARVAVTDLRNVFTNAELWLRAHADQYGGPKCDSVIRVPSDVFSYSDQGSCDISGATVGGNARATSSANQSWALTVEPGGNQVFTVSARGEGAISGTGTASDVDGFGGNNIRICFTTMRIYNYQVTGSVAAKLGPPGDRGNAVVTLHVRAGFPTYQEIYQVEVGGTSAAGSAATLNGSGTIPPGNYCLTTTASGTGFLDGVNVSAKGGFGQMSNVQLRLTP